MYWVIWPVVGILWPTSPVFSGDFISYSQLYCVPQNKNHNQLAWNKNNDNKGFNNKNTYQALLRITSGFVLGWPGRTFEQPEEIVSNRWRFKYTKRLPNEALVRWHWGRSGSHLSDCKFSVVMCIIGVVYTIRATYKSVMELWITGCDYRLLDSLVVECWLRVREVPGSIPNQVPRHTKDVIKLVPVVLLFSTQHWRGKYWLFLKRLDKKIM